MTKHLHVYRIFPYRAIFANAYGFNFWLFSLQLGNRSKQLSVFKEEKQAPVHFCWIYQREKWCLIVPPKGSLILEYVPGFGHSFSHDQRCIQYILFFGFTRCDVTVILWITVTSLSLIQWNLFILWAIDGQYKGFFDWIQQKKYY